jgi:outer membrane lipoprotein-sorting protein
VDCERARRAISERMDGERLPARTVAALEQHLEGCSACRAFQAGAWKLREAARFEIAPAVPDLVDSIMSSVEQESHAGVGGRLRVLPSARGVSPRPARTKRRLAPVAAAAVVGLIAGSVAVGGPWQQPQRASVGAAEVARGVAAAATQLSNYGARFTIIEQHFSADVPVRRFTMGVWFHAPESFRLDVVDHTRYPTNDVTPTNLELIVNGSSSYSVGPSACPASVCPPKETVVRNRVPFSASNPAPTDLILPVASLADANQLQVVGGGIVLGRQAIEVRLPFEQAQPLFPFPFIGGSWRPFFPTDRVDLWLDAGSWFPLRYTVYPAPGRERGQWALRFGLPQEPPRQPIFEVSATSLDEQTPAPILFRIPRGTKTPSDQGAKPVSIPQASRETGWHPIAPAEVQGLDLYQVVLPPTLTDQGKPAQTLITYSKGLAWLKIGEVRGWTAKTMFGPVGIQAQQVTLGNGGIAYYEPATADHGRRLAIHGPGTDLYIETNLPREGLLSAASSLPVTGIQIPEAWAIRSSPNGVIERVSLDQAAAALPFPIQMPDPSSLPAGYTLASAELVTLHHRPSVNVFFQQQDAEFGTGPIRLHEEPAKRLPPASAAVQDEVEVRGVTGRWTQDRNQLEWVQEGVYYSLDAAGMQLTDLVGVAGSLQPATLPPPSATTTSPPSPSPPPGSAP